MEEAMELALSSDGPAVYEKTIIEDEALLESVFEANNFAELHEAFGKLDKWPRLAINRDKSVSEEKVPEQNLVTLLVTKDSQIFLSIAGDRDSTYSSEKMREEVLLNVVSEYNKKHPNKKIELTNADVATFGNTYMYGLPLSQLAEWCKLPTEQRDALLDPLKNKNAGIPIDMGKDVENRNAQDQRDKIDRVIPDAFPDVFD